MSKYKNLIDEICQDNDYVLTFQVIQEAQNLAKSLIAIRDGKVDTLDDLLNIINVFIERLHKDISECIDDEIHKDYLEGILYFLQQSQKRVIEFN
jgi:hypothetical protein